MRDRTVETYGKYKVTVMVTVDLEALNPDVAYRDAIDVVNDALEESGMKDQGLRVTGIAQNSQGEDMVYRYDVVAVESLI